MKVKALERIFDTTGKQHVIREVGEVFEADKEEVARYGDSLEVVKAESKKAKGKKAQEKGDAEESSEDEKTQEDGQGEEAGGQSEE